MQWMDRKMLGCPESNDNATAVEAHQVIYITTAQTCDKQIRLMIGCGIV